MQSSPLAALQPQPFTPSFGMGLYARSRGSRANSIFGARLGVSKPARRLEFDSVPTIPESSPTTDLVADLSQNFHIDKTPQIPTPRRSLFTNFSFDKHASAAPSSPVDLEMDMTPLPHKPAFVATLVESPLVSPLTESPDVMLCSSPPPAEPEADILPPPIAPPKEAPKRSILHERKKSGPIRQPFRHKSSNVAFKHTVEKSASFNFGSKGAATLDLSEMFGPSPPPKAKKLGPAFNPCTAAPPPRPKFSAKDTSANPLNGSPVAAISRRPSGRPKLKIRRTMSMFDHPEETMVTEIIKISKQAVCPVDSPAKTNSSEDILPSFTVKDCPLRRIKSSTMLDVLDSKYKHKYDEHIIVDCRFEYEYQGGHVAGAINVNTMDSIEEKFFKNPRPGRTLIIFHCEYSAHRAPRMASHFRSLDRQLNMHRYPALSYPDIYILDGGYSGFFQQYRSRCEPQQYVEMNDASHRQTCEREMGKFRRRSKLGRAQSYTFGVHLDSIAARPSVTLGRRSLGRSVPEEGTPTASGRPKDRRVASF